VGHLLHPPKQVPTGQPLRGRDPSSKTSSPWCKRYRESFRKSSRRSYAGS
jgi:hypothetical protein